MRRRLLNLLTAVSLLVCVTAGGLWMLSYWGIPELKWGNERDTGFGWLLYDHQLEGYEGTAYYSRCYGPIVSVGGPGSVAGWEFLGGGVESGYWGMVPDSDITVYRRLVRVPFYWLVLLGLPLPLARLRRHRRAIRRRGAGSCHVCGYDLRATPGRCPECGAPGTRIK